MPVGNCLPCLVIGIANRFQLRQGNSQPLFLPADGDEHLVVAFIVSRHTDDVDFVFHTIRRRYTFLRQPAMT